MKVYGFNIVPIHYQLSDIHRNNHIQFFEKRGFLTASFLFFYGIFRFFVEYFREPDGHIGLIYFNLSMGQILSLPMIVSGLYFMTIFYNKRMDN